MGADGAGVVEAVGPEAEGVSPGERVLIMPGISCGRCAACKAGQDNQCERFEILGSRRSGTYAEFVVVPDQNVMPIPDDLRFEDAAAFPLAYWTAWHMLMGRAKLRPGETVVVVGASSGVGLAAVQIAKAHKARVLGLTSQEKKRDAIISAGADDVLAGSAEATFSTWVTKQTSGRGADIVVDHVGPATFEQSLQSVARYGRLVTCGSTSGPTVTLDMRYLFSRDLSILGARMGTQKEFQELTSAVFSGKIKPIVDKVFPLSQATQAHAYVDAKKQVGKVVMKAG
jgi:NADPH:quinone reductase-like Zn-dependent oxidoreductase